MNFDMSKLIFEPIVSLSVMLIWGIVMLIIVLLNRKHIIHRILIIILLIIISQRPMIKDVKDNIYNGDYDIVFVIDNTVSMNSVDVNGISRIAAVKRDCEKIVEDFAGAEFAIINFSNVAQLRYPMTRSSGKILDAIGKLKTIDPNYAKGSSLDLPIEYLKMVLESSREKEDRKTVVFFLTDGELDSANASTSVLEKYKDLKSLVDSGAVLGYGSPEGSKIKITESVNLKNLVDSQGYLINSDNNSPYISKLEENNLKILADNLGINYFHMTDYSVLESKIYELKKDAYEKDEEYQVEKKVDIYFYFTGALSILLLIELYYNRRNA